MMFNFFFFFQAEDGIRDATVTGVQTCALPICRRPGVAGATARVAATGDLQLRVAGQGCAPDRVLTEARPLAWQERAGVRVAVAADYALAADGSIGLALGPYDPRLPLVVDPTLIYST